MEHTIFLCLGTNVGDRMRHLQEAIDSMPPNISVIQLSSIYETKPVGYTEQLEFLNQVLKAQTDYTPFELLNHAKIIESKLGRTPTFRFGPRPIDVDVLFYNDLVMETTRLTIPHPRLAERAFALIPLAEIAPDFIHPGLLKTVKELRDLVNPAGVKFFANPQTLEQKE